MHGVIYAQSYMYLALVTDKLSTAPDCHIQESCSDDDTSCSRSAAIGNAKRNNPATSFTIQSRKRRRRRKKDKTIEHDTNNVNKDRENGKSVRTTPQLTQPASCGTTSTCTTVLDNHLHTNSTRLHDVEDKCESSRGGETFQLFVHIDGDSVGEEPTCQPEYGCQESKQRRCRKMKISTKQALRGGSAQYCDKRTRKRLLKCKTKHHPSTELSNCHTPITSMGASRSNSVSKQGALCEESYDRLKGKELRQSHTPPSVDTGHHVTEVTQYEGSKSHREAGMEKSGHRGRITRGNSGHKRRVMRYRKGRRLTQVGQLLS